MQTIVEVGVGQLGRSRKMLEFAAEKSPLENLKFAGIDLFESRVDTASGVELKAAHRELKPLCGKLQLIPGDVYSALARSANSLTKTDLLIFSAGLDADSLAKAWFYVPRMLHDQSLVFLEEPTAKAGETQFRQLKRLEIEQFASTAAKSMRRAA
ncbi:MAG TPA: hypothetical protein VL096_21735 [Pirellulaceae bacterium]|nr:hypothetical protein [Pirellulaceae bacterium]